MKFADWIGADWGTSRLRAWAMSASGEEIAAASSDDGCGNLEPGQFEDALVKLISPWLQGQNVTVLICGAAGGREGWVATPYARVPCRPDDFVFTTVPCLHSLLDIHLINGVSQASPADVIRGEETQIAGFLSLNPGWDGVICLPGTHTKWAHISAGEIVSFQTFMTGEIFGALTKNTLLRHTISSEDWDDAAFLRAVDESISKPERFASRLFSLRAEDLLTGTEGSAPRARLSGFLIGAELAAARPYWLGQNIALLGTEYLGRQYGAALAAQGAPVTIVNSSRMTIAGLNLARRSLIAGQK